MSRHKAPKVSLVFRQTALHHWKGRLLNTSECIDGRTGGTATRARFDITENPSTGRCSVLVQGSTTHGRRYVSYANLDAAQRGGLRWAARRFVRLES